MEDPLQDMSCWTYSGFSVGICCLFGQLAPAQRAHCVRVTDEFVADHFHYCAERDQRDDHDEGASTRAVVRT